MHVAKLDADLEFGIRGQLFFINQKSSSPVATTLLPTEQRN